MAEAPKVNHMEQAKKLTESANRAKALAAQLAKIQAAANVAKGELEKESDEDSSEG